MRELKIIALSSVLAVFFSFTAFAGQWNQDANGYMYIKDDGTLAKGGWVEINGLWYFFDANGYMLRNTWIDEYYVGDDGVRTGEYISTNTPYPISTNNQNGAVNWNTFPSTTCGNSVPPIYWNNIPQAQKIVVSYEIVY